MGRITCCNVLSDLYAMGVVNCDNMLLLLGVPQEMSGEEREVSLRLIMQGFRDCALEAGTFIRGGQTVLNPWLMMGGVATSVCSDDEFIMPDQAVVGDVLVLTKPLGTQVAVNVHQWMLDKHSFWVDKLEAVTNAEHVEKLYLAATLSMARLNRNAAQLMHKYKAHGCTDVTGFGLLGHADNLSKFQANRRNSFEIHTLPCLAGSAKLSQTLGDRFKLFQGLSPETSGGLLVAMPREEAIAFCAELQQLDGSPSWIVGDVIEADSPGAKLSPEPKIIEVEHSLIQSPIPRV